MPVIIPVLTESGVQAAFKLGGVVCPNLSFESGEAVCAAHGLTEYIGSPCHIYGNSDYDPDFAHKQGRPCRIGEYFRKQGRDVCAGSQQVEFANLEYLGSWKTFSEEMS